MDIETQRHLYNLVVQCPHCLTQVTPDPQHEAIVDEPSPSKTNQYYIVRCPNYMRLGCAPFFIKHFLQEDVVIERYPIPNFTAQQVALPIPDSMKEDYAEARRCLYVESYKGAVTLCRRVMEAIAIDKLEEKAENEKGETKKLHVLIDLMRDEGLITEDLKKTAHEIRHFGNYGAHAKNDGLDKVEPDEAGDIAQITYKFLDTIYISPQQTEDLKSRRENKAAENL